ncbi:Utp11-domain-containing protein [Testicularia cyperi]|uniref:Utp11-domain-containing protein n=1 Tax=Testicularia cyperi TaxID=1882483 RepID=A0A317XEA2_9BASI|nr:Utp11-domain-containing protein [Testicularia cyperi]
MVGSSLRNAVQRRNHKERSQPVARSKLGFLEKHKDYVLRAKDHHAKRDKLKRLAEKAAMRNKDEFYFGMINSKTKSGVHVQERGTEVLDNDVVALLKTQDIGYVRAQIQAERKRVNALVARIAPSVPSLRAEWLDERENRRPTLQKAGLIADSTEKKNRSGKHAQKQSTIGAQGKKTVWLEDADAIRAYTSRNAALTSASPSSSLAVASTSKAVANGSGYYDDDDNDEEEEQDDEDDEDQGRNDVEEFDWSDSLSDQSSDDDSPSPSSSLPSSTTTSTSGKKTEKHISRLVSELALRYRRLEKLQLAADKLNLVRALMTNKRSHSHKLSRSNTPRLHPHPQSQSQAQALKSAISHGATLAKNRLVLPAHPASGAVERKTYKFSSERKR